MPALDASVVAAVDNLELIARVIVEGLRTGQHRSPFHGFNAEFSQYRSYRPGDDLKYLDWKVLARTNRLYTRQFRETTNMSAILVLDASASMAFPSEGVSKFRYASMMAAALAYVIAMQGDRVGLMTMAGGSLAYVPPKGGRAHLQALLARIDRLEPAGAWEPARVVARAAELLRRRGLMFVLSDFYDAEDETWRELKRASRRGHEVAMLQVISRGEIDLPYRGDVEFEDLESGATRLVDADTCRRGYRGAFADFLERWRARARRDGIDYALMPTDMPPSDALRGYLVRRGSHATMREPLLREAR